LKALAGSWASMKLTGNGISGPTLHMLENSLSFHAGRSTGSFGRNALYLNVIDVSIIIASLKFEVARETKIKYLNFIKSPKQA